MATKKIKVETGEGLPDENTKGGFYKDLLTDILYSKNEAGLWDKKPVIPENWGVVYQSNPSE